MKAQSYKNKAKRQNFCMVIGFGWIELDILGHKKEAQAPAVLRRLCQLKFLQFLPRAERLVGINPKYLPGGSQSEQKRQQYLRCHYHQRHHG